MHDVPDAEAGSADLTTRIILRTLASCHYDTPVELILTTDDVEQMVSNIQRFQELDPFSDDEYEEMQSVLEGLTMMFDDILLATGKRGDPLTRLEKQARIKNPYYRPVGNLPSDGTNP